MLYAASEKSAFLFSNLCRSEEAFLAFIVSGISETLAVADARATPTSALMKAKLEDEGYWEIQIEDFDRAFTAEEFERQFKA